MATLSSRLVISLVDRVTGPARGIAGALRGIERNGARAFFLGAGQDARRAGAHFTRATGAALAAGYGLRAITEPAREFNQAIWDTTAALLGQTGALKPAQEQAEVMRKTAIDLSRAYGVMPESFAKAGAEAAKMGLSFGKSQAVMRAAGMVQTSDSEADAAAMAKSLGTYGIIYGAPEDDTGYGQQVQARASSLALAGAKTRTSASKIEEGLRNYMSVHGAFGGQFEDAVALIAMGSQTGLLEKETGTALKTMTTRFLNMPTPGRAALGAAGIDMNRFMDFSAADPFRATGNLITLFPEKKKKGARGRLMKFLEKAQRDGRMKDPSIIEETLHQLENEGVRFAGAEDRDAAVSKIAAVLHGAGGKFDPLGFFAEVQRAIDDGRAGPGVLAQILEPKRAQQYLSILKTLADAKVLRDDLVKDQGRYLELIGQGYQMSDAGKIVAMEAAWRRLNLALVRTDAIQKMVGFLARMGEALASMPGWAQTAVGGVLALSAVLIPLGMVARGIVASLQAVGKFGLGAVGLLGVGRGAAAARAATTAASAAYAAGAAPLLFGMRNQTAKAGAAKAASARMVAGMGAQSQISQRMVMGMSAFGAIPPGAGGRLASLAAGLGRVAMFAGRLTLVGAALTAITGAISFIANNMSGFGAFFSGIGEGFMNGLGPARPMIESIASAFTSIFEWFGKITGPLDESGAKWKSWGETVGDAIALPFRKLGELYDMIAGIGKYLADTKVGRLLFGADDTKKDAVPSPVTSVPQVGRRLAITPPTNALGTTLRPVVPSPLPESPRPGPTIAAAGNMVATGTSPQADAAKADISGVQQAAQQIPQVVSGAMAQARSIISSTNLFAEGQRIMESLAAGMNAGVPAVQAAASRASAAAASSAIRGAYSDAAR